MIREELVFVATCDISGLVRGKGFPARELPARLKKGVGWTGSNLMMSPFGPIWDTPFGTAGDLMIVPDPAVEVRVDFADGSAIEHFFLGDSENFVETSCAMYTFCLWQGGSLFVTNPLGALASLALHLKTGEMI